ncbi:MAG TPA: alpha/beta hydrolase [Nocardia sp.]|uniref:alpha/beta fold hydrolase n=1 Tax=Nocardia sp. TaxID=1821 RepID=UPI002B4B4343|nr:alpha/beta hydrolase [Nocardia sp.]HLS79201.1 alpha/beta hydrolase [Nocardia sp.]
MLVTSMKTLAGVRDAEPLTAAYRAALRSRTYSTAALNKPRTPSEKTYVTTVDGARLRVRSYGPADGEVIVLIHGWSCCIEYWNPQIDALADRFRVVAYDQRGHGDSSLGRVAPSDQTLADDLAAVLDATLPHGRRAVLVGHSMGGITVQSWARRYSDQVADRVAAAVLVNTAAQNIRTETDLIPVLNKPLTVGNRPLTLLGRDLRMPLVIGETLLSAPVPMPGGPLLSPAVLGPLLRGRVVGRNATDDDIAFAMNIVRSCRPLTRGLHAAALAVMDLGDAAYHLTVPTTVISGSDDKLLPERMNQPIVEALRATGSLADYQIWPTGHLANVELADRFNVELIRIAAGATEVRADAV